MTSKSAIGSFRPWAPRTPRHIRDVTRPFRIYFHRKRMRDILLWMAVSDGTTIIDDGGTPFVWHLTNLDPSVTIVNLKAAWPIEGSRVVLASGLALPFRDRAFDVCFSNSVIEHVGDARARADFAREVRRVVKGYWVQTPNRNFPLETYFVCLFLHWLPFPMTWRLIRHLSVWDGSIPRYCLGPGGRGHSPDFLARRNFCDCAGLASTTERLGRQMP
jgi:Methyltransferase domain